MSETKNTSAASATGTDDAAFFLIRDALRQLRFGTVTVVIQDGVVVQVERTEKTRLPRKRSPAE